MRKLKATPDWLRANPQPGLIGVDRENRVIHGFIVAEEGPFRSQGRGEFDSASIKTIQAMMAKEPNGLKSRFTHPTLSSDGLGKFLGRAVNPTLSQVMRTDADGKQVARAAVRADLHLSDTAFDGNPNGDLGSYILDLAEEDPDAMGASLVLRVDEELREDEKKRPLKDAKGRVLPPLWRPTELHAIDVVDTGDATRAFLSADGDLPDELVRRGAELLDWQFPNADAKTIRARCESWLGRYLSERFGKAYDANLDPEILGKENEIQLLTDWIRGT